jgi:hypothetical protein
MAKFGNCGKAVKALANSNAINSEVATYMTRIHEEGCKAKHDWSSGKSYFLETAVDMHQKGHVNDTVMSYFKQVNADANKAKHK